MMTALRWVFATLGAYLAASLCVVEFSQHRVGLGTGIVLAMLWTAGRYVWNTKGTRA